MWAHHPVAINKTFSSSPVSPTRPPQRQDFSSARTRTQPHRAAPVPAPAPSRSKRRGSSRASCHPPPPPSPQLLQSRARAVTPSEVRTISAGAPARARSRRGRTRASRPTTSAVGSARRRAPQPPGRASQTPRKGWLLQGGPQCREKGLRPSQELS
ncbi:hypothetical protein PVAP13_9KG104800 [Panicum virgatum]|uniref:Uncharacterized protein n=1 Tax=Panicum virgatum TaxID=38727 RepID=A0A8T0NK64_PANVG|nr:hypothetical protein PVAP13_9KG104800 [Panicum virgatum]KAG2547505.1 hypothetical protein PVAP13_9KG104800 [Panicum virgatum]KAG2547506.1 hypothetical protein PVAP13_9KG104800 [Panicum virgatum]